MMKIQNYTILPGERSILKLYAGRLPSDTPIPIHVHIYRSLHPGPTVLLIGGMHGDEVNGIEILRRCIYDKIFDNLNSGSVVVIPLLNIFGFINYSRDVPDGKDVNRSFPGSSQGSLARRVAHKITKEILGQVDMAIDFHTGGDSRYNLPQIRYTEGDEPSYGLAKAFNPHVILPKPLIKGSFRAAAYKRHIPIIVYEGGEALRWNEMAIQTGINGIQRVLKQQKMLNRAPEGDSTMKEVQKTNWLRARYSGLFKWFNSSGDIISKGDVLGQIADPNGEKSHRVIANSQGIIIGHNNAAVVHAGDALFHIGHIHH